MSVSVDWKARATFEERSLAVLERCVKAVELLDQLDDKREAQIAELHQENAELRDGLLALSNRIESLMRTPFDQDAA